MKQINLTKIVPTMLIIGGIADGEQYINMTCNVLDADGNTTGNDEIIIPMAEAPSNIQSMAKNLLKFVGKELNKKAINEDTEPYFPE